MQSDAAPRHLHPSSSVRKAGRGATALKVLSIAALGLAALIAVPLAHLAPTLGAGDPVIAAAGDIACDPANAAFNDGKGTATACDQKASSDLLVGHGYAAVLPLGDNQYYCGSLAAFEASYDKSWGRVKSISHPVPGVHEYLTSASGTGESTGCDSSNAGAAGYYAYFGSAAGAQGQGWYSYDIGAWHLIALNTQCTPVGGCDAGSPQGKWLAADLASHKDQCILAYWHLPLFSSGGRANSNSLPFWQTLYAAGADVILSGDDHIYERFSPQTPTETSDPQNGIVQFTVGTGGANHTSIAGPIAANSVVRDDTSFGVLALTLHQTGYSWRFIHATGSFTDSGSASCHHAVADPSPSASPSPSPSPGGSTSGSTYVALKPARILDTRYGNGLSGPFGSHLARTFQVTGRGGVPAGAVAVTGNLTVTRQTSNGYLYVGPVAVNDPTSSNLNFPVGDDRANAVSVALGSGGTLSVTYAAPTSGPTADVVFDVSGYFVP